MTEERYKHIRLLAINLGKLSERITAGDSSKRSDIAVLQSAADCSSFSFNTVILGICKAESQGKQE